MFGCGRKAYCAGNRTKPAIIVGSDFSLYIGNETTEEISLPASELCGFNLGTFEEKEEPAPRFVWRSFLLLSFGSPPCRLTSSCPCPEDWGNLSFRGFVSGFHQTLRLCVRSGGLPVCANLRTSAARCMESRISSWQITMRSRKCIHQWLG